MSFDYLDSVTSVVDADSFEDDVEAGRVLEHSASESEVAQFVATHAAAVVGADYSNLALLVDGGSSVRLYHGSVLDPSIADRYAEFAVDAPYPIAVAIRTGRVVVVGSHDEYRERYPEILPDTIAAGIEATVSLPLYRGDGSIVGALGFAWATAPRFDPELVRAVKAMGVLCSDVVQRAAAYHADRQLAADLHRKLLGVLPAHPGVVTEARYLPAGISSSVGGDWYEGLALDAGRFAVVVGDVVGHGFTAAADMACVRGMISSRLYEGVRPDEVFGRVSTILCSRPGALLATAAVAIVDPIARSLTYATAGHPPLILIEADGSVRLLDDANAPMLGITATHNVARTVPFPPSSKAVMFTDGLVERRDRPADVGIAQACDFVRSFDSTASPADLIDALLVELVGGRVNRDDIAVVVIESVGLPA